MQTSLFERDQKLIWHPFTQAKTDGEVLPIQYGKGAYLYDEHNRAYLDLISSWWVTLHGHAEPSIAQAIYEQAKTLEQVIFAGFTHQPAVALCEGLQSILPDPGLSRFFFSDNGSTAVEVSLKMAYQYWCNTGQPQRTLFLSFEGGYHGDTFGAMSVGSESGFHDHFKPLFFKVLNLPYPETFEGDTNLAAKEALVLETLERYLAEHGQSIAAFILEPLIQGASGMRFARPAFIQQLIQRVQAEGILVILDEIMTGFGRTGHYFALNHLDSVQPDFMCLSKGLTGGFLPLSLTVTHERIYQAFFKDEWQYAFTHGHSYTGNPLACAAALASLKLLQSEACTQARGLIQQVHQAGLKQLAKRCSQLEAFRSLGTISAFRLKEAPRYPNRLKKAFLEKGLLIRPLGKDIYLIPPYCISAEDLERAYVGIGDVLV